MRYLVVGDIHGGYRALLQVLERATFSPEKDTLIGIGDYCDGWSESFQTIEYLRNLPNFVGILGNHDAWALDWLVLGNTPTIWTSQGGEATLKSYSGKEDYFDAHKTFLLRLPTYIVLYNKMFVHGGFIYPIEKNEKFDLLWDRDMFAYTFRLPGVSSWNIGHYDEVYIGHTSTSRLDKELKPLHKNNIWAIDQGAGCEGKLTLMDIHTHEYWQSDNVHTLYPNEEG